MRNPTSYRDYKDQSRSVTEEHSTFGSFGLRMSVTENMPVVVNIIHWLLLPVVK